VGKTISKKLFLRGSFMKRILLLIAAISIFYVGCSKTEDITNPAKEIKIAKIHMPAAKNLAVETELIQALNINGDVGDKLEIAGAYESVNGQVTVFAELKVSPGAFEGVKEFVLKHEGLYVDVKLYPHMAFDAPVYLDVKMTGLDLSDISDPREIQFVYFAENGSIEPVSYEDMTVNLELGILEIKKAHLNHFSRYGWAKIADE
jgi:hypothetical protein